MRRKIYAFLYRKHPIGFVRFCYAMLIPCAMSKTFNALWLLISSFFLVLAIHAKTEGWDKE